MLHAAITGTGLPASMTGNAKHNHPASQLAHEGVRAGLLERPPYMNSAFRTFALQLLGGANNSAEVSMLAFTRNSKYKSPHRGTLVNATPAMTMCEYEADVQG